MIFRQLFDISSSTYTYLLACEKTSEAVLIDAVFENVKRDLALIDELGLKLMVAVDTHCHADHVTSAWLLKQKTGCRIASAAAIKAEGTDWSLADGDIIHFGEQQLTVLATPGHTDGCLSFVTADQTKVFTGDALLIRGCGRCDFQQGSASTLYHSITEKLFALPDNCVVYPGHDYSGRTSSTIAEEKRFNARVGGNAAEQDFVGYMDAMQLPHPKLIDYAVPANLVSGKPEDGAVPPEPNWAPIRYTFSGLPEVTADWVMTHNEDVYLLDVREASELESEYDRIEGAKVIALSELRSRVADVPKDKPVVCLCRSGRRSAMAVTILQQAGITDVANISGGVLAWREFN